MDVRAQTAMVFHLDKCIGCHTCSVACKNVWTDRPGAEYMWWNNVETKPGTGYPERWEDQERFRGGWTRDGDGRLALRSQGKWDALLKLFYNPAQPNLDDYYEPWTYRYADLFDAKSGDDQPTAIAISQITGEPMAIERGPNWDDDLAGSPLHAEKDVNLDSLTETERKALFDVEQLAMMYLPRICNHCANPSCVASCPSGALYKRGEDGIVLIDQDKCRGWRACVAACPYKKIYFNWKTGKSEKCILCFPRLETGQAPACFHSCVGRIRYLGVLFYDAERVASAGAVSDDALVESYRSALLDPRDPDVLAAARRNGISEGFIDAAQRSPVWRYVVEWKLALPLHPEYRTFPMLFYVPPLLPVMGRTQGGLYGHDSREFHATFEDARIPIQYLANLFAAGNRGVVEDALRRLAAVRAYKRAQELGDLDIDSVLAALRAAGLTTTDAEAIHRLTAIAPYPERFVIPPIQREEALPSSCDPEHCKGSCGLGASVTPERGA
ncbi:MAG: nitrate reductase subunit beta [Planctomycetes bacterium]|nr:nitrate reductase subunit beta [Planctomycetota bacterium]